MKKKWLLMLSLVLLSACSEGSEENLSPSGPEDLWLQLNETTWWKDNGWAGETYVFFTDNKGEQKCLHQVMGSGLPVVSRNFVDCRVLSSYEIEVDGFDFEWGEDRLIAHDLFLSHYADEPLIYDQKGLVDFEAIQSGELNLESFNNVEENQSPPRLSDDRKQILARGQVLLSVDDERIFNFFKGESPLCDQKNVSIDPHHEGFCENKERFKELTSFSSIEISPDASAIAFTIETEVLQPDTILGIFYPEKIEDDFYLLTNYYLGNAFMGFSPEGNYFVYQGNCWEARCALYMMSTQTGEMVFSLNDSEQLDDRYQNIQFARWLSEDEIEYYLDGELKQAKIQLDQ